MFLSLFFSFPMVTCLYIIFGFLYRVIEFPALSPSPSPPEKETKSEKNSHKNLKAHNFLCNLRVSSFYYSASINIKKNGAIFIAKKCTVCLHLVAIK